MMFTLGAGFGSVVQGVYRRVNGIASKFYGRSSHAASDDVYRESRPVQLDGRAASANERPGNRTGE
jgi:hypothetical protein